MRILGIDPGTAIIGYGMIECERGEVAQGYHHALYGSLHTDKGKRAEERLREMYDGMVGLFRSYKPDICVIEKLFFARNVSTALGVGQARGVILLAAEQANVPIFEYTPMQVKQQVTGYGKAEKKQLAAMVKKILLLDQERTKLDDAWDALGIALTHVYLAGLATKPDFIVPPEKAPKVKRPSAAKAGKTTKAIENDKA